MCRSIGVTVATVIVLFTFGPLNRAASAGTKITHLDAMRACGGHMDPDAGGARSCLKGNTAYYCGGKNRSSNDCEKFDLGKTTAEGGGKKLNAASSNLLTPRGTLLTNSGTGSAGTGRLGNGGAAHHVTTSPTLLKQ
jgi:hypothetical protein